MNTMIWPGFRRSMVTQKGHKSFNNEPPGGDSSRTNLDRNPFPVLKAAASLPAFRASVSRRSEHLKVIAT